MRIGVIADTHLYRKTVPLPGIVPEIFAGVDHIIHAGDIVGPDVIPRLEKLAPVTAVAGNLDTLKTRDTYGEKKVVRLGVMVGVCHGDGNTGSTLDRAIRCFQEDKPECIVYGHSHIPYIGYHNGVLVFNPGSPTDKRRSPFFSVGMIEINGEIRPRIISFDREGNLHRTVLHT